MKLLLASNSPRRRELLAGLDIPMEVVKLKDIDETHPAELQGADIPLHIARLKMGAYDMELAKGDWDVEIEKRAKIKNYYSEQELRKIFKELVFTFSELQNHNKVKRK